MDHHDHLKLLRDGISSRGGVWADLGSGTGAFTKALVELLGPTSTIYSIDRDAHALNMQERELRAWKSRDGLPTLHYLQADFTQVLDLPPLEGVVMANSLHFVRYKEPVLMQIKQYLKADGVLILVEYNTDRGNPWVPYPLSFTTWQSLSSRAGFAQTHLLHIRPSRFLGEIYSAASYKIK